MDRCKVALPIRTQAFGSASGADDELRKPIACSFNLPVISRDHTNRLCAHAAFLSGATLIRYKHKGKE